MNLTHDKTDFRLETITGSAGNLEIVIASGKAFRGMFSHILSAIAANDGKAQRRDLLIDLTKVSSGPVEDDVENIKKLLRASLGRYTGKIAIATPNYAAFVASQDVANMAKEAGIKMLAFLHHEKAHLWLRE